MNGKQSVLELAEAFSSLDKVRNQFNSELVKAANQALGAEYFSHAGFSRCGQVLVIHLEARIPIDNPSGFCDCD